MLLRGTAVFTIGENVQICAYTILNGLASITFEDFSSIGPHGSVLSSCDNFEGEFLTNATIEKEFLGTYSAPVLIGRHAVIATGATILPGVTIAEGTVVGAHSLVKNNTLPYTIVAGIPAKIIKHRSNHFLETEKKFRNQIKKLNNLKHNDTSLTE